MIAEVPLTLKMSDYVTTWYSISEHGCIRYCQKSLDVAMINSVHLRKAIGQVL